MNIPNFMKTNEQKLGVERMVARFTDSRAGGLAESDLIEALEAVAARINDLPDSPRVNAAFQKFITELEQHINAVES